MTNPSTAVDDEPVNARLAATTGLLIRRPELGTMAQSGAVLGLAELASA